MGLSCPRRERLCAASTGAAPPAAGGACAGASCICASSRPTMAATRPRASSFAQAYSPTNRPLRSTVMRSQISYTWSRKCVTNRIATPRSRSRRSSLNNACTSSASRLEVGSSRISTRASVATARATVASCCRAAGSPPASCVTSSSMPRSASKCAGAPLGFRPVDAAAANPGPPRIPAGADVFRHGQVGQQVAFLVHRADAEMLRMQRRVRRDGLAIEDDASRVGGVHAGEHLDQRRLAGAVLSHQRVHLTGAQCQLDAGQRLHPGEGAGDVPCFEHDGGVVHVPVASTCATGCAASRFPSGRPAPRPRCAWGSGGRRPLRPPRS